MNKGLNLDLIQKTDLRDYQFAGEETCKLVSWELPENEMQIGLFDDTKSCVTFAITNQIECLMGRDYINDPWLKENGYIKNGKVNFSDRFTAVMSNTTNKGNSGRTVYKAIREHGLIPEDMHPFARRDRENPVTFEVYHDKSLITDEMKALGKEFLKRFELKYFQVSQSQICAALEKSPLLCYVRTRCTEQVGCTGTPNHAVMLFTTALKDGWKQVYDSYESSDKDYIRLMDKDYEFVYGLYHITIKQKDTMNFVKEKNNNAVYIKTPKGEYVPIIDSNVVDIVFGGWDKINVTQIDKIDEDKISKKRLGLVSFE